MLTENDLLKQILIEASFRNEYMAIKRQYFSCMVRVFRSRR
jgi:hypothetical protein